MTKFTSFHYVYNSKSEILSVVLHGSSKGINSPFIEKIFETLKDLGESVLAFNFPYLEKGRDNTSGPKLKKEVNELRKMLNFVDGNRYKHIRLVGKSLGAVVASYYLKSLTKKEQKRYSVVVLGYVKSNGGIDLESFLGSVVVIQGENDQFGNIKAVRENLKGAASKDIQYFEIKEADHSYRDPETREPKYEDKVIEILQNCTR